MKKIFQIAIDCPACAMKAEEQINKVDGVSNASVNFIMQRLTLEYDEAREKEILKQVKKAGRKADGDFDIVL